MVNIDTHMDLVPEALMNWGMKNISGAIMDFIKKAAEELPENHRKKREEKAAYYEEIRQRLAGVGIETPDQ